MKMKNEKKRKDQQILGSCLSVKKVVEHEGDCKVIVIG